MLKKYLKINNLHLTNIDKILGISISKLRGLSFVPKGENDLLELCECNTKIL